MFCLLQPEYNQQAISPLFMYFHISNLLDMFLQIPYSRSGLLKLRVAKSWETLL